MQPTISLRREFQEGIVQGKTNFGILSMKTYRRSGIAGAGLHARLILHLLHSYIINYSYLNTSIRLSVPEAEIVRNLCVCVCVCDFDEYYS